ncbi:leucine-rich repeats and immunoglobulin-like domains protein sma-10 [Diorhabda sublineata]|uniref:leucine-rich repeats and immunoglobulin-like domains protein sma-10 n=1 Tax=Diorhabda sublineata TaxID=1163346 RepID=UPI0024E0A461|nr:leucine-rich repeats and immunoglobulin-like domains protein sma-10 [Diorhabda sublineata]
MDLCAIFFVISLCKLSTSVPSSRPENTTEVLETTTQMPCFIIEMGKSLTSIPRGAPHVKAVNYGYNIFYSLPQYAFSFNNFVLLERIQLHHNQLTSIHRKAFRQLDQLKSVDLSGNNLTTLDLYTFKTNTNLEKLDLTSNKIRFRNKPFLYSTSLVTLILSDNRIEQIFVNNFSKLPKLRNLVLNSNVIFFIADCSFAPLKDLVYLSLAHTGVYRLSTEMFSNSSYPRIIDVTDSPLATKFNPPLRKVKNEGVRDLINIDKYF